MFHIPLVNLACIRSNKIKDFMHSEHLSFRSLYNEPVQFFLQQTLFIGANLVLGLLLIASSYSTYLRWSADAADVPDQIVPVALLPLTNEFSIAVSNNNAPLLTHVVDANFLNP